MIRERFICIGFAIVTILAGVSQMPAVAASQSITIEAGKTGEPISKYIYGQFIEHQGRCIYGGIWAEMLEDRKFFYPINFYFPWGENKNKSPWKPVGFDTIVVMNRQNSYVGEHTPQINLDGQIQRGIMQDSLALRNGKKYEGRIILAGSNSVKVRVSLVWGPGRGDRQSVTIGNLTKEYTKTALSFTAGVDSDNGRFEIIGNGEGTFYIGAVSLMPADNVHGMRADVIELLKELDATVYRWPGGTFAERYNWLDMIGERDSRPARMNTAYWSEDIESNDFGLDEFMFFCSFLNAEPYIAVNTVSGDAASAVAELEYLNGSIKTPMGKLRAKNGHRKPYNVKWWGIGNETYFSIPVEKYVVQYNSYTKAMRQADPSIKFIAVVGGPDNWYNAVFRNCAENLDLVSGHLYCSLKKPVVEHVRQMPNMIHTIAKGHRDYCKGLDLLKDRDIRIAMDEWNYWYEVEADIYGEAAPRRFHQDALGIAAGLHAFFRNTDVIFMANTHPVNVHGCIKTTKTEASFEVQGLVMKMYRHHFGDLPVVVAGETEPLDVAAAWTGGRKALTVGIVNPTEQKCELTMNLKNAQLTGDGRLWVISHSDPMAYNAPGEEPQVVIEEKRPGRISNMLSVPPLSISLYELPARCDKL